MYHLCFRIYFCREQWCRLSVRHGTHIYPVAATNTHATAKSLPIFFRALCDSNLCSSEIRGRVIDYSIFWYAVQSQNMPHAFCQEVLRDETGLRPRCNLKAFRAFAATQLAEENIDFLAEVRTLLLFSDLFVFPGCFEAHNCFFPTRYLRLVHSKPCVAVDPWARNTSDYMQFRVARGPAAWAPKSNADRQYDGRSSATVL